jgi:peptide/nickel transport system permease protein
MFAARARLSEKAKFWRMRRFFASRAQLPCGGMMTAVQKFAHALSKLAQLALFMAALSVIVFALARLAPGDPLISYYGDATERMSEAQRQAAMERLSLDKPLFAQYFAWAKAALGGDFGLSFIYKQPASSIIGKLWLNTLLLGGGAYALTFLFAVLLGIFCARREGTWADAAVCKIGTVSSLIPTFFVALLAILLFSVELRLLPASGAYSAGRSKDVLDRAAHLALPIFTLVVSHLWYYAYMVRNKLIDELHKDYVLLLRVKRLSMPKILYRHCLKNILPSLITMMAISVPHIIAGTYIAELVFGYPGLGTLAFESARYKDYNMLSLVTLLTGFAVIACGMLGQELSALADPNMRFAEEIREQA